MMKLSKILSSPWFAAVVIAAGIGIRAAGLIRLPLDEGEAKLAYQIFQLYGGHTAGIWSNAFYSLFTLAAYWLFGASDVTARLLPFLCGSLILFLPLLVRDTLGPLITGIFILLLTFDPALIYSSISAQSPVMAVFFLGAAALLFLRRKEGLAGFFLGGFLLSGPAAWLIFLVFIVTRFVYSLTTPADDEALASLKTFLGTRNVRALGIGLALTLGIVGTGFFLYPTGIPAAFQDLAAFVSAWFQSSDLTPVRMLVVFIAYLSLYGLAGSTAYLGGLIPPLLRRAIGRWLLVSGLVVLFYPGHQSTDWVLLSIPLGFCASYLIARALHTEKVSFPVLAFSGLWVVLGIFTYLNYLGLFSRIPGTVEYQFSLIGLLTAPVLAMISYILVGWGWSFQISKRGALITLVLLGLISGLSTSWHAALLSKNPEAELWNTRPYPADADLLQATLDDLSWRRFGVPGELTIQSAGTTSFSQRWYLRTYKNYVETTALNPVSNPDIILTSGVTPQLASAYRGQDFVWLRRQDWSQMDAAAWAQWLAFRTMKYEEDKILLWARTDLFSSR